MSASALISAADLAMMRGERLLFRQISLEVAAGEALVLRGANGAGKTTLLRILAGLTRAEAGNVTRNAPHHWVAHREGLKPHETPRQHLTLWARAWGVPASRVPEAIAGVDLSRPQDVPARHLSAGQRRRTALGRLLLDPRPLWLLDEPFTALDADGRLFLQSLIDRHRTEGGAVIAAIHGEPGFVPTRELLL